MKKKVAILLAIIIFILPCVKESADAGGKSIQYLGSTSYGASKVGKFKYGNDVAFCMEHEKASTPSNTPFNEQIYNNDNIRKTLYYGWKGTKQWSGFKSESHGIVATTLTLSHYYAGTKVKSANKSFYDWLIKQPAVPSTTIKLSKTSVTASITSDRKKQKTENIKFTADKTNYITIPLPSGVSLYNVTTKKNATGKVKVYGGQSFYLTTSATKSGTFKSGDMKGALKKFQAVLLKTKSSVQNLGTQRGAADPASKVSLTVKWRSPGKIILQKVDSKTGKAQPQGGASLKGAQYKVYTSKSCTASTCVSTITTNASGTATTGNLAQGTYYVKEYKASKGYTLDKTVYTVALTSTTTASSFTKKITSKEKVITGKIEILKSAEPDDVIEGQEATKLPLKGAKFTVKSNTTKKVLKTITTDAKGYAAASDLLFDTYTVTETLAPPGFEPVKPFTVSVNEAKTYKYNKEDKRIITPLIVAKKDATTEEIIPFPNTTYKIKDESGNDLAIEDPDNPGKTINEFVTDESGTFYLPVSLPFGKYQLKETKAPPDYLVNDYTIDFEINADTNLKEPLLVEDFDHPAMGKIKLKKTDIETSEPLKNVKFEIIADEEIQTGDGTTRAEEGDIVDHLETDGKGQAVSRELYLGRYRVVETKQAPGYERPKQEWKVTLTYADQETAVVTEELNITNRPAEILIKKKEAEEGKSQGTGLLAGVKFKIWKTMDEEINPEMYPSEEYTTGADGTIRLTHLLPGEYRVQEVETLPGYILDDTVQTFSVDTDGYVNKTELLFSNMPGKGRIHIRKTDAETNEPVEGAEFDVIAAEDIQTAIGTQKVCRGDIADHLVTNAQGQAASKNLYLGKYRVVETKQAPGYKRPQQEWEVTLAYENQETAVVTEKLNITNSPTKAEILKTEKNSGKPLTGIKFLVWRDKSEEEADLKMNTPTDMSGPETPTDIESISQGSWKEAADASWIEEFSTKDGKIELSYLIPGAYHVKELQTLPGYILDDTVQTFTVDQDGNIDRPVLKFVNDYTKLTVSKTDEEENPLRGARLQLQDKNGKVLEEWVSDEKPKRFERLPAGKYRVIEEEAPKGYELAEPMEFELINTAEEQSVIIVDEKTPQPSTEKAGTKKSSGPGTGDGEMFMSLMVLLYCVLVVIFSMEIIKASKNKRRYN